MRIFSKHRKKIEPKRRFGSMSFRNKVKKAANYKRAFNPSSGFSLKIFTSNTPMKVVQIVSVAVLLIIFYFLVISSYFTITDVQITGNRQVPTDQIENALASYGDSRFFMIKKNDFFLMSRGRVNELLTSSIPTVKSVVKYNRSWPNKVSIEITEHTPGFVIESSGKYFLVDDEGVVVSPVDSPGKLLVASDQLVEDFGRNEGLPNQKLAPFIISMSKSWSTKINTPLVTVKFPGKASNDVQFVTGEGWTVLMDTTRSASVQLANLAVILSKKIGPANQSNLAYIDLRISKWVYYCFKASPCQQQDQPTLSGTETDVQE